MRRFVVAAGSLDEGEQELPKEAAAHLRDVLRLRAGDQIVLCDGAGIEAGGELVAVSKSGVRVRVGALRASPSPVGLALTLIQAIGKGDKMDSVVRQTTELGVRRIVPVVTARSVPRAETRLDRWRSIAEDAVRVSGRVHRPEIEPVQKLEDVLARPRPPIALCFAGDARASLGEHLDRMSQIPEAAEVIVGPEGGLTDGELARAEQAGYAIVHLGAHTLRTETAGAAIAAILLYWARAIAR